MRRPEAAAPTKAVSLRLFRCGIDEKRCTRREHPGWHPSWREAERCASQTQPVNFRKFRQ